ncbi:MAG: DNA mismatch repair protein MutS [Planctomycetes bacterium]|nr:DNA mismatch repair protein MutS [Planctomycetota bacterium]
MASENEKNDPPAMRHYKSVKAEHPDTILLYRMGDFYELFYDDAVEASKLLGITLTSRGGEIPMAGVPARSIDRYVGELIELGCKVTICDQVEDPKQAKGLVKREVTRIITPGTITESELLEASEHSYLLALNFVKGICGIAYAELSTGRFEIIEAKIEDAPAVVGLVSPREILASRALAFPEDERWTEALAGKTITRVDEYTFDRSRAFGSICEQLAVKDLSGFGVEGMDVAIESAGALLSYLMLTSRSSMRHIISVTKANFDNQMALDRATRSCLELTRTFALNRKEGSLLSLLNETETAMGARMLTDWVLAPLRVKDKIDLRLGAVDEFFRERKVRELIREELACVQDLERIAARIGCGRASPRDLAGLRTSLSALRISMPVLTALSSERMQTISKHLDPMTDVEDMLTAAIVDSPPLALKEGGIIRKGFNADLDELRMLAQDSKTWIANYQQKEIERLGIPNMKIGYNRVFGYYIEISRGQADKAPANYHRRQSLKNAERFVTDELREYEQKVLTAESRANDLEEELFTQVRETVTGQLPRLLKTANAIAEIDVYAALAEVAERYRFVRPEITDSREIDLVESRHPMVEKYQPGEPFIPNDCAMSDINAADDGFFHLITGPNMAGKSTYIRQIAVIVLMAQMGSFVPAKSARIGVVDRVFARIGSGDDLTMGASTFMVEMRETANILHNSTDRSLLVFDEVGRGTSTFDGLSIAWAICEYILERSKARTLFATHYHELTELEPLFDGFTNKSVLVKEWKDEIRFLRKIVPGGADKSYGIHVARMAGIPNSIILRSKEILSELEKQSIDASGMPKIAGPKTTVKHRRSSFRTNERQIPLFGTAD